MVCGPRAAVQRGRRCWSDLSDQGPPSPKRFGSRSPRLQQSPGSWVCLAAQLRLLCWNWGTGLCPPSKLEGGRRLPHTACSAITSGKEGFEGGMSFLERRVHPTCMVTAVVFKVLLHFSIFWKSISKACHTHTAGETLPLFSPAWMWDGSHGPACPSVLPHHRQDEQGHSVSSDV